MQPTTIQCLEKIHGSKVYLDQNGIKVTLINKSNEPEGTNRLLIERPGFSLELLPTKGLCIGEAFADDRPMFWDPPQPLFDPKSVNLKTDKIHINGKPSPGCGYLKHFMGGVEMLGLGNWGMHKIDEQTGELHVLHGEVHSIPVEEVKMTIDHDHITVTGLVVVRSFKGIGFKPWYKKGKEVYHVQREYKLSLNGSLIKHTDTIINVSDKALTPDWGYHITFRPENGSILMVPSSKRENRGGNRLPEDIETWQPSPDETKRAEQGIIYKELDIQPQKIINASGSLALLKYPDGKGIAIATPPVPYYQTWFCAGGANSKEFTYPCGTPVLKKNWDGQGIEIGSSPLDHDGNVDPSVESQPELAPREKYVIQLAYQYLNKTEVADIERKIRTFQQKMRDNN